MVFNYIKLLMFTGVSVENPLDKFGRDLIGSAETLWDSGIIPPSDFMCSVFIISSVPKYMH